MRTFLFARLECVGQDLYLGGPFWLAGTWGFASSPESKGPFCTYLNRFEYTAIYTSTHSIHLLLLSGPSSSVSPLPSFHASHLERVVLRRNLIYEELSHKRNLLQDVFLHARNAVEEEEGEDSGRDTECGAYGCDAREETEVVVAELGFGDGVAAVYM